VIRDTHRDSAPSLKEEDKQVANPKLEAAAGAGVGVVLIWAAIKDKSVLSSAQAVVQGKNPKTAAATLSPVTVTALGEDASGSGTAAVSGGTGVTAVIPSGASEKAFWIAVLTMIGAPPTSANINSLTAWAQHEGPWGTQGENGNNPLNTSITGLPGYEGKWSAAPVVSIYATAAEGAAATAATLLNGSYPQIVGALRSGNGLCGQSFSELSTWSGGGYSSVC
jgi:hypothetical protein